MNETSDWDDFANTINQGSILDRITGMIFGHALGDAMGIENKFKTKNDSQGFVFPTAKSTRGFVACDWSSNTDHMIIIMHALISGSFKIYPCDIASRLRKWLKEGFKELGDTMGTGANGHMSGIINHEKFLEDPYISANEIWVNSKRTLSTNGSLARTSILGSIPDVKFILQNAPAVSAITHVDPKCQAACVFQSLMVNWLIYNDRNQLDSNAIKTTIGEYSAIACKLLSLEDAVLFEQFIGFGYTGIISSLDLGTMAGMSYVLRSISVSAYALQVISLSLDHDRTPSFEKFMLRVVAECGDSDSNAAISGAILGSYLGYSNLPRYLIKSLPHYQWLGRIVRDYLSTMTSLNPSRAIPIASTVSTANVANTSPPEANCPNEAC